MRHKSPTVHSGPRPSTVRPTMRVTTPTDGASCACSTAWKRRAGPCTKLSTMRSVATGDHAQQRFDDARDTRLYGGIDAATLSLDDATVRGAGLVGHPRD